MYTDDLYNAAVSGDLNALRELLVTEEVSPNQNLTVDDPSDEWTHKEFPVLFSILATMSEQGFHFDVLDLFVQAGVDLNGAVLLRNGKGEMIRPILEYAISLWKSPELTEYLLRNGADPNLDSAQNTPTGLPRSRTTMLWYALSTFEDTQMLELLLKYGADPNRCCVIGRGKNQETLPPLFYALCQFDRFDGCVTLLRYGADPQLPIRAADGNGMTACTFSYYLGTQRRDCVYRFDRAQEKAGITKKRQTEKKGEKTATAKRTETSVASAPVSASRKSPDGKRVLIPFLILFLLSAVVGNLINAPSEPSVTGFYGFFYSTVPSVLAGVCGLPLQGAGAIFTLISSALLWFFSYRLHQASLPERKLLPFDGASLYLALVGSVAVEPSLSAVYTGHKFLLTVPLILLFGYLIFLVLRFRKSPKGVFRSVCRLLSGVGFTASIVGFSGLVLHWGVDEYVVLPSRVAQLLLNLGNIATGSSTVAYLSLPLLFLFAGATVYCWRGLRKESGESYGNISFTWLVLLILFFSFSPVAGTSVYGRGVKYWLLLLTFLLLALGVAGRTYGSRIKTLLCGFFASLASLACLNGLFFFYNGIDRAFTEAFAPLSVVRQTLLNFLNNLFHDPETGEGLIAVGWIIGAVVVAAVCLVAYLPWKGKKETEYDFIDDPSITKICSLVFLAGVTLRNIGWNFPLGDKIAYCVMIGSAFLLLFRLVDSIVSHKPDGVRYGLIGIAVTVLLTPVFYFFAQAVGAIVAVALGSYYLYATVKNNLNKPRDKWDVAMDRLNNAIRYGDLVEQLEEDVAAGRKDLNTAQLEADLAGAAALQTDRELRDEGKNL